MKMAFILAALLSSLALPAFGPAAGKPGIVFILSDDLLQDDLQCYARKFIPTPNADRMGCTNSRKMQG